MELLSKSKLAERLGRSNSYVSAMVRAGFQVPCGRTTLRAALDWMAANPEFRVRDAYLQRDTLTAAKPRRRKSATETPRSALA